MMSRQPGVEAVIRVSGLVKNLKCRIDGASGTRLFLTDLSHLLAAGRHFASPLDEKCRFAIPERAP